MTQQLSLFANHRPAPKLEPVDPDGRVIDGAPDVTYRLPHPKLAWDMASIQIHEHEDGRWMWAVHTACGGYKVGPKWGRFAPSAISAASFAAAELLDWCDRHENLLGGTMINRDQLQKIRAWAEGFL